MFVKFLCLALMIKDTCLMMVLFSSIYIEETKTFLFSCVLGEQREQKGTKRRRKNRERREKENKKN